MDTTPLKDCAINIVLIAYRNKYVFDTINNAIDNAEYPGRLTFKVIYQDSHHRKMFSEKSKIDFFYYKWDETLGFSYLKNMVIKNIKNSDHILVTSPNSKFNKNWDTNLLKIISEENCVVSSENDFIDSSFMFFKKETIKNIKFPSYLKMLGESEDLSIKLYCAKINMKGGLKNIINPTGEKYDYLPFSKNHNYDEVERLYRYGINSYCSIIEDSQRYLDYSAVYNIKKIYDQLNDVEYNDFDMPYLDPERFKYGKSKLAI